MAESGPNIAPFLDLAVQIIQASGGDTKRADEAAHILASSTAVNTYPAVEGLVEALEPFTRIPMAYTDDIGNDATVFEYEGGAINLGHLRAVHESLSRFRSIQNGGAN